MKIIRPHIEPLEARIAPAAVFTLMDVDGDLVTIKTSKGTNADLAAVVSTNMPAGSVAGGVSITKINLAANPVFDGTNLSVTAKPGPLGGDGLVNVADISASGLDLGVVKVKGDLANIDAGKGTVASKIKSISANSTSGFAIWTLGANVGSVVIARDLRGTEINVDTAGTNLGLLKIGGSLIGQPLTETGFVSVASGTLGKIIIGGSIVGGTDAMSPRAGAIVAKDILSVRIGGSLIGGEGQESGQITATGKLGTVAIKGDIRGANFMSGYLLSSGSIGVVSVGGSVFSGRVNSTGFIESVGAMGPVKIGGDLHSLKSGGVIEVGGDLTSLSIGGSLIGGAAIDAGLIKVAGAAGPIKIAHNIVGGAFLRTGSIQISGDLASLTIGGDILGSTGIDAGAVKIGGATGAIKIGGSIIGDDAGGDLLLQTSGKLASLTIGGDILGNSPNQQLVLFAGGVGTMKIGGSVISILLNASPAADGQPAIKSLTIGGRVEDAQIFSSHADAQFGAVKVGGDWIRSTFFAGADAGADGDFGTADDTVFGFGTNVPTIFSKIASITIAGQVVGTTGGTDHFGFVAQEIGSMKINGVKVPLTIGKSNDTDVNDTRFILGATRDVTVHEVA